MMLAHTNCFCLLCAGRNNSYPTDNLVSPLSPSFHHRVGTVTPPSPLSPTFSSVSSFRLPSPAAAPLSISASNAEPSSPAVSYSRAPRNESAGSSICSSSSSSTLSIAELSAADFPSPAALPTTEYLWDICVIPSIPADFSVFQSDWNWTLASTNTLLEEQLSPTTLFNGRKAVCSSAAPRPQRPQRSPELVSRFSWSTGTPGTTPFASPGFADVEGVYAPVPVRFSRFMGTCATLSEEVRAKAGRYSISSDAAGGAGSPDSDSIASHLLAAYEMPWVHTNMPFWSSAIPVNSDLEFPRPSPPYSPALSGTSADCEAPSCYFASLKSADFSASSPTHSDIRRLCWSRDTSIAAAEYAAIFNVSVYADPYAWIRYPCPSAPSTPSEPNPTSLDRSDPFADFDAAFQYPASCSSSVSSDASFGGSAYSGDEQSVCVVSRVQSQRARFIAGFLTKSAVESVKEVCEEAHMQSIDGVSSGLF